jgi:multidrug efflux pump subunit AcrA (membrane-fusion protein)
MKKRLIWIVAGVLLLAAVVWIIFAQWRNQRVNEYSGTVETREIEIGSKIGGRVTEVPVEEGQQVKAGTLLVRFECDELKAQRVQAAAAQQQARADLDRLLSGNRPEEIEQAEAAARNLGAALEAARNGPRTEEVKQARADYAAAAADAVNSEAFFQRMARLVATDTISRQQFDDAKEKRDAAKQRAESARQHLDELEAGTRPEDLRAAEERFRQAQAAAQLARKGFRREDIEAGLARLAQAQGLVAELDARLKEAELTAPADAVIEVVSVRPGDLVPAGQIVVNMQEPSQIWVKVYVPETDLAKVRVAQKATVSVDGLRGQLFAGRVGQIASQAEFLPRNVQTRDDREHQVFGVKVYVDNSQGALKSGMSATVRLE